MALRRLADTVRTLCGFTIVFFTVTTDYSLATQSTTSDYRRVCYGTNSGLDHPTYDYVNDDSMSYMSDDSGDNDYSDEDMEFDLPENNSQLSAARQRYHQYRSMYANCTFVEGNLEIVFLMGPGSETFDLDFLGGIQEVTGYVLIVSNSITELHLDQLRIIRGDNLYTGVHELDDTQMLATNHNVTVTSSPNSQSTTASFKDSQYSLYIALNYKPHSSTVGLRELRLTSLREIIRGNVFIYGNNLLCHEISINWEDILTGPSAQAVFDSRTRHVTNDFRRTCSACHEDCQGHCWGDGNKMCQILTRLHCPIQCDGRCYGNRTTTECCSLECAGGCTGGTSSNCLACKTFIDDGKCVTHCPPLVYLGVDRIIRDNPAGKYMYGRQCVKQCPPNYIARKDVGACVSDCGLGRHVGLDGKCVESSQCIAGYCPKKCYFNGEEFLNAQNIEQLVNCTIIVGGLRIQTSTFTGDSYNHILKMRLRQLDVLKSIEEITDYLVVDMNTRIPRNLSFLSNLRAIHGRRLSATGGVVLKVFGTQLKSLDLNSLKTIGSGDIIIGENDKLCFVSTINWGLLRSSQNSGKLHIRLNRNQSQCVNSNWYMGRPMLSSEVQSTVAFLSELKLRDGHLMLSNDCLSKAEIDDIKVMNEEQTCSAQCSSDGCWGTNDDQCLRCEHYAYGERCVANCSQFVGHFADDSSKKCSQCDEQCVLSTNACTGPGESDCLECSNFKLGAKCVEHCPKTHYVDSTDDSTCQPCHPNCSPDAGCTGPLNGIGPGRCVGCWWARLASDLQTIEECLPPTLQQCPDEYYEKTMSINTDITSNKSLPTRSRGGCAPCHSECMKCHGPGAESCDGSCRHYSEGPRCVRMCSLGYYASTNNYSMAHNRTCQPCHSSCSNCTGPSASECASCRLYTIYNDFVNRHGTDATFNCTDSCPDHSSFKLTEDGLHICAPNEYDLERQRIATILSATLFSCVFLVCIIVVAVMLSRRHIARSREKNLRLQAKINGLLECEPLTLTSTEPDMAMLKLINECNIRRGDIIGSGAFGTVYKGFWIPDEGVNIKVPVAIKVLQDSSQSQSVLDEARIMASVVHPCCLHLLAVCLTSDVLLITQLMPLGCLLDYVRKNRSNIGSQALLNWCTQIAKGMAYLESRNIIHRDLAARNVLVHSSNHVKITDFGLAKLVNTNEAFKNESCRMPIKWMALESIRQRIYSHKGDVWSFGVTVWELFTYGKRPYENVKAMDMVTWLEKGERLAQPSICTIDVYMIMIKCWLLEAERRPSFTELAEEFAKMARDPGRYLVIPNDQLMRLPSHASAENNMIWSNNDDGPEEIVLADDYVNHKRNNRHHNYGGTRQRSRDVLTLRNEQETSFSSCDASTNRRPISSSSPLVLLPGDDELNYSYSNDNGSVTTYTTASTVLDTPDRKLTDGKVLKLNDFRLPLDKTEYLQPQSSAPAAYLELSTDYTENDQDDPSQPLNSAFNSVFNPEYYS